MENKIIELLKEISAKLTIIENNTGYIGDTLRNFIDDDFELQGEELSTHTEKLDEIINSLIAFNGKKSFTVAESSLITGQDLEKLAEDMRCCMIEDKGSDGFYHGINVKIEE